MLYEARPPRAELEPFVRCLWRLRGAPSEIEPQPIVPDGCFELIVHLGEPFVEQGVYAPEEPGRAGQAGEAASRAAGGDAHPHRGGGGERRRRRGRGALPSRARLSVSCPPRRRRSSTRWLRRSTWSRASSRRCRRGSSRRRPRLSSPSSRTLLARLCRRVGSDPRFDRIAMARGRRRCSGSQPPRRRVRSLAAPV